MQSEPISEPPQGELMEAHLQGEAIRRESPGVPRATLARIGIVLVLLLAAVATPSVVPWFYTATLPEQDAGAEVASDGQVYFVDTEGWYRITDHERAVLSPFELELAELPESLPMELGPWRGESLALGPEIDAWFDSPEIALQREYQNDAGDIIWLSLFGSRGPKSFRLFEHTPATCYPLSGWSMTSEDVDTIRIGGGEIYARRGFAFNNPHELIVLYMYVWDNPGRDPTDGVLSLRVSAPILSTEAETLDLLKEDFLPRLFTDVVQWRRFG
jgi:hypothetical protein